MVSRRRGLHKVTNGQENIMAEWCSLKIHSGSELEHSGLAELIIIKYLH